MRYAVFVFVVINFDAIPCDVVAYTPYIVIMVRTIILHVVENILVVPI